MERKEKTVRRVFNPLDLTVLAGILAVGIVLCLTRWSGIGICLLVCWAFYVPFCRHGYRIKGEEGFFHLKEIPVARECKDEILSFLEGSSDTLKHEPWQGGGALVEIYSRKKDDKQLARYFDYADLIKGQEYEMYPISAAVRARLDEIGAKAPKKII